MDEEEYRIMRLAGTYVCDAHIEDEWLAAWVRDNASSNECDYCSRVGDEAIAAGVDELAELVLEGLGRAYGNADDEGVPWEGGYVLASPLTSAELLNEEGPFNDEELISTIADSMPHDIWVQRDFLVLAPYEQLRSNWRRFVALIKHESRYFFGLRESAPDDPDDLSPAALLRRIGIALEESGAIRVIPAGTVIYRAVAHSADESPHRAGRLGTAPVEYAIEANRMSAAGIPMFYGSLDAETARIEAARADPEDSPAFTVGAWEALRDLRIVDFSRPIHVPSLFDPVAGHMREELAFLRGFVEELSRPVERDRTEHIEYVPTQVVTEYLRSVFKPEEGVLLDGIAFMSAQQDHPGRVNLALFVLNEQCVNADGTYDDGPDDEVLGISTRGQMRPEPVLKLVDSERFGEQIEGASKP